MAESPRRIAEAVRTACLEAALRAYENAGMSGLCHEGRWECAISAMRSLDIERVIEDAAHENAHPGDDART
jgi:hypothetical protein